MKTKQTKEKYTRPNIRLVEWSPKEPICNQIISTSICLTIDQSTRADHFHAHPEGSLNGKWESWPDD